MQHGRVLAPGTWKRIFRVAIHRRGRSGSASGDSWRNMARPENSCCRRCKTNRACRVKELGASRWIDVGGEAISKQYVSQQGMEIVLLVCYSLGDDRTESSERRRLSR